MICIIALFVFAVLSIFSAKYRPLARRAFDCVFRRLTLRPCDTGFDVEMKALIASKLIGFPWVARLVNRNFELISWTFTALMFASLFFSVQGAYNWYYYGNCNGPESTAFCIFNAFSQRNVTVYPQPVSFNAFKTVPDYYNQFTINRSGPVEIVEIGCFSCPFTKQAEPLREQILQKYPGQVEFYFKNFPLPGHPNSRESAIAGQCAVDLEKDAVLNSASGNLSNSTYWKFHDLLFAQQDGLRAASSQNVSAFLTSIAVSAGYDRANFSACLSSASAAAQVDADTNSSIDANTRGTPTYFIRNTINSTDKYTVLVGPQPFPDVSAAIDAALKGKTISVPDATSSSGSCPVDLHGKG